MKPELITQLAHLSKKYTEEVDEAKKIKEDYKQSSCLCIRHPCYSVDIDLELYPELRPLVEKLCDYLIKSEPKKQKEIIKGILYAMEEQ
jgi:hypothetical protein